MSLKQAIQSNIKDSLGNVYTSIPAIVTGVTERNGSTVINCEIAVRYMVDGGLIYENAPLQDVPLRWPSAGGCYITMPIEIGDTVMINFAMRDCSLFMSDVSGDVVDPYSARQHDMADAFATPSMLRYGDSPKVDNDGISINSGATEIRILKDGTIELGKGSLEKALMAETFMDSFFDHQHTYMVEGTPILTSGVTSVVEVQDTISLLQWEGTLSEKVKIT